MDQQPFPPIPPYQPYQTRRSGPPIWVWFLVGCGCFGLILVPIVAAILFPVFSQARESARATSCLKNERQMALGIRMYAQDYDEQFPMSANWMDATAIYNKDESVFHCPTAGRDAAVYGYAYNSAMKAKQSKDIDDPRTTLLLYDSSTLERNANDLEGASEPQPGRHRNGNNEAWADGHAKWNRGGLSP